MNSFEALESEMNDSEEVTSGDIPGTPAYLVEAKYGPIDLDSEDDNDMLSRAAEAELVDAMHEVGKSVWGLLDLAQRYKGFGLLPDVTRDFQRLFHNSFNYFKAIDLDMPFPANDDMLEGVAKLMDLNKRLRSLNEAIIPTAD